MCPSQGLLPHAEGHLPVLHGSPGLQELTQWLEVPAQQQGSLLPRSSALGSAPTTQGLGEETSKLTLDQTCRPLPVCGAACGGSVPRRQPQALGKGRQVLLEMPSLTPGSAQSHHAPGGVGGHSPPSVQLDPAPWGRQALEAPGSSEAHAQQGPILDKLSFRAPQVHPTPAACRYSSPVLHLLAVTPHGPFPDQHIYLLPPKGR